MKKLTDKRLLILTLVGTFGYLLTKDLALLAWAQHDARSAHVMAQAACTKLVGDGLLLARDVRLQPGMKHVLPAAKSGVPRGYVLTKKGAAVLNDVYLDAFIETPVPASGELMLWFADGYHLSMTDHVTRAPLIQLLHEMLAHNPALSVVGRRGAARNAFGLARVAHFDAALVDDDGQVVFGVYLAHHHTAKATAEVAKLAAGNYPFIIAADTPSRLATLQKWRATTRPALNTVVWERLPSGVDA